MTWFDVSIFNFEEISHIVLRCFHGWFWTSKRSWRKGVFMVHFEKISLLFFIFDLSMLYIKHFVGFWLIYFAVFLLLAK